MIRRLTRSALALSALIMAASIPAGQQPAPPEIVAHRGASQDAPENTLAAVRLGWQQEADAVEVDVYLTADRRIVCLHDDDLKRTAGDPRKVADVTLADLRELEAGAWKGARWAGEPIPLLQHVLMTIPEGRRLFVEIKIGPEITPHLADLVRQSGKAADQVAFISFNAESCRAIKRELPAHQVYLLRGFKEDEGGRLRPTIDELIAEAKELGVDGVDVARTGPLTRENVARIHDAGLFLAVYTVDDPAQAMSLAGAGVDSITTNVPALLKTGTGTILERP